MFEVLLLGSLEVRANGAFIPLGTRKQQIVFAMLAVHSGRVVTLDELIDELWPASPRALAVANTRTYATNLRRSYGSVPGMRGLITRRGTGYQATRPVR